MWGVLQDGEVRRLFGNLLQVKEMKGSSHGESLLYLESVSVPSFSGDHH